MPLACIARQPKSKCDPAFLEPLHSRIAGSSFFVRPTMITYQQSRPTQRLLLVAVVAAIAGGGLWAYFRSDAPPAQESASAPGAQAQAASAQLSTEDAIRTQDQAQRDSLSGVNLDEEAADLQRYQQAYQASAKAMQVSNELFSSIVQMR